MGHFFADEYFNANSLLALLVLALLLTLSACSILPFFGKDRGETAEIVLITEGNFMYLAKVTKPYTDEDSEREVHIFNDAIREKVGDRISHARVATTRVKPLNGWGTRPVAIQYLWEGNWIYTEEATEFEDHYRVPTDADEQRKLEFKQVRFLIPLPR